MSISSRSIKLCKLVCIASILSLSSITNAQETFVNNTHALSVLKDMKQSLATSKTLTVHIQTLIPTPEASGKIINFFSESEITMKRPNKLYIETRGDLIPNNFYYNGNTATSIGAKKQFYAQTSAGSDIDSLLLGAHPGLNLIVPFIGMFVSDPLVDLIKDTKEATWVGESVLGKDTTNHIIFTSKGHNFEIWVNKKDSLPNLVMITNLENAHELTIKFSNWHKNVNISDTKFNAVIPKKAIKLEFKPHSLVE